MWYCGTVLPGTPFQEFKCGSKVSNGTLHVVGTFLHVVGTFLQKEKMEDALRKLYLPLNKGTAIQVEIDNAGTHAGS